MVNLELTGRDEPKGGAAVASAGPRPVGVWLEQAGLVVADDGQFAAKQFDLEADLSNAWCAAGQDNGSAVGSGFHGGLEELGVGRAVKDGLGAASAGGSANALDGVALAGVDNMSGAAQASLVKAAGNEVDGDDRVGAGEPGELNGELADGAGAEDGDGLVELERAAADAVERDVAEDAKGGLLVGDVVRQAVGLGLPVSAVGGGEGNKAVAGVVAEAEDTVTLAVVGDARAELFDVADCGVANGAAGVGLVLNGADAVHFRAGANLAAGNADEHLVGPWIGKVVVFDFNGDTGAGNKALTVSSHVVSPVAWLRRLVVKIGRLARILHAMDLSSKCNCQWQLSVTYLYRDC